VRHFFADREVELVTLAHRAQGLMLAPGNPRSIRRLEDLARHGIRFVNRNSGSGTRLWLEHALRREGIDAQSIPGYALQVSTHTEAASLIHSGRADAALGLQASAHEFGLDFIPLFEERYDVVLPRRSEKMLGPFLDFIQTGAFRSSVNAMTGYNTAHSGELILL
jgi:putative molybdopterin biosynthesis protein